MNTGFHQLGRVSVKRLGLAFAAFLELLTVTNQLVGVYSGGLAVRPGGGGTTALDLLTSAPFAYTMCGVALVGLVLFARGQWQVLGGAMALLGIGSACEILVVVFDPRAGPNHYYGGAVLVGWCAGLLFARCSASEQRGTRSLLSVSRACEEESRYAVAGGIAMLVAIYTCSGLSKLLFMGPEWVNPFGLRAMAGVFVPSVSAGSWVHAPSQWLLQAPPFVTTAMAAAALVLEVGAIAMLCSPRIRTVWGLGLAAMHIAILLVTGGTIFYDNALVLLLVFCIPWGSEPEGQGPPRGLDPGSTAVG